MAASRCGILNHIFNSPAIPLDLKLKVYRTAVCSLLTYGSEAWQLTESTMTKLNGCNARCLSHITGLSAHEEVSDLLFLPAPFFAVGFFLPAPFFATALFLPAPFFAAGFFFLRPFVDEAPNHLSFSFCQQRTQY